MFVVYFSPFRFKPTALVAQDLQDFELPRSWPKSWVLQLGSSNPACGVITSDMGMVSKYERLILLEYTNKTVQWLFLVVKVKSVILQSVILGGVHLKRPFHTSIARNYIYEYNPWQSIVIWRLHVRECTMCVWEVCYCARRTLQWYLTTIGPAQPPNFTLQGCEPQYTTIIYHKYKL